MIPFDLASCTVKPKLNLFVDLAMTLFFVIVAITGLVIYFLLPEGRQSSYQYFMGITKSTYVLIHDRVCIVFFASMLLYIALHARWSYSQIKALFMRKE